MARSRRAQRDAMHTMITITPQTTISDAERKRNGGIPRNFKTFPVGYFCPQFSAVEMPLYPEGELQDRIRQKDKDQSWISDVLKVGNNGSPTGNLYQDGWPYCWSYSSGNGQQAARAVMGLPFIKLSAFAVAYIIKGGRKEGGWGPQSAEWAMKYGYPSDVMAPNLKSVRDTPELRADMAKYKINAMWYDLVAPVYDRKLSRLQVITSCLNNCPIVSDFNWWSHSVLIVRLVLVKLKSGAFRIDTVIQNNWDPDGLDCGNTILAENRAWPNSAVAIRSVTATAAPKHVVYPEPYYTPRPV